MSGSPAGSSPGPRPAVDGRRDDAAGPGAPLTLWAAALLLVACVPLAEAFTSPVVLLPVGGAVVVVLAVVALARRWRIPEPAAAVAVVAGALVVATSMARTTPTAPLVDADSWRGTTGAGQLLGPVVDTVARLLTAPRPASPALALPVVLLATVVTLGVALALGRRAPARVAPLVGAGVLYGSALLLTAGTADRGPVGVGLVALTAAGWLLLDGDALVSTRDRPALGRAEPVRRARWRATGVTGAGARGARLDGRSGERGRGHGRRVRAARVRHATAASPSTRCTRSPRCPAGSPTPTRRSCASAAPIPAT